MTDNVPGVTACPGCGGELATVSLDGGRPTQTAQRDCTNCSESITVDLCWYPDENYVVIGEAAEDAPCDACEVETNVVTIDVRTQLSRRQCTECLPEHLRAVWDDN